MSWSIYAKGELNAVRVNVATAKAHDDQEQIDRAKRAINNELNAIEAGAIARASAAQHPHDYGQVPTVQIFVDVEAGGHSDADGNNGYSVKVSRLNLLL